MTRVRLIYSEGRLIKQLSFPIEPRRSGVQGNGRRWSLAEIDASKSGLPLRKFLNPVKERCQHSVHDFFTQAFAAYKKDVDAHSMDIFSLTVSVGRNNHRAQERVLCFEVGYAGSFDRNQTRSRRRQGSSDQVRGIRASDELCIDGPMGEMRGNLSGRHPDERNLR